MTEGPDAAFGPVGDSARAAHTLAKYGVDPQSRFLLYVGGLSPHKNLGRLIAAWATVADSHLDAKLVLVGDFEDNFTTEIDHLRAEVDRLGLEESVHLTGFVPDADLAHFYRQAEALVQPSLMEGFGLPAVEAMASGTPVLSSTAGSLPEVVGPAGWFFDPTDGAGMAATMNRLLDQPTERNRLARLALVQARQFTWTRAARLLLDCFEDLDAPRAGWATRRPRSTYHSASAPRQATTP